MARPPCPLLQAQRERWSLEGSRLSMPGLNPFSPAPLQGTGTQEVCHDRWRGTTGSWPGQKGPEGTQPQELATCPWGWSSDELRGKSGDMLGAAVSPTTFRYCVPITQLRPNPGGAMPMGAIGAEWRTFVGALPLHPAGSSGLLVTFPATPVLAFWLWAGWVGGREPQGC